MSAVKGGEEHSLPRTLAPSHPRTLAPSLACSRVRVPAFPSDTHGADCWRIVARLRWWQRTARTSCTCRPPPRAWTASSYAHVAAARASPGTLRALCASLTARSAASRHRSRTWQRPSDVGRARWARSESARQPAAAATAKERPHLSAMCQRAPPSVHTRTGQRTPLQRDLSCEGPVLWGVRALCAWGRAGRCATCAHTLVSTRSMCTTRARPCQEEERPRAWRHEAPTRCFSMCSRVLSDVISYRCTHPGARTHCARARALARGSSCVRAKQSIIRARNKCARDVEKAQLMLRSSPAACGRPAGPRPGPAPRAPWAPPAG